jgi:hypothetical protein
MGRPERPLDDDGPIADFARDLRELRKHAGNPSYRELARRALFVPSVLSSAASGYRLPTLAVTLAFVSACGGDCAEWERRWRAVAGSVWTAADPRAAGQSSAPPGGPGADPGHSKQLARTGRDRAAHLAPPAQLPMSPSLFVGRRTVLAQACAVVREAGAPRIPLVIRGPIGVGKTALALRLADAVADEFPDGQLYADLSTCGPGNQSSDKVMRGFLRALGVPADLVPDDPMQRIGLYRSLLAQRRLFVLLENAGDEGQVRPLIARTAHSQVVVTSRARLLGLDGARCVDLGPLARAESVALLARLVGDGRIGGEHARASAALAELCGDLPLALDIIGRKLAARPEWSVRHAVALLADRERLMSGLRVGDVNVRDRLVTAYQLLSPDGRKAVRQLGLAGSGWTTVADLAAALEIRAEAADELLESLVDAGLLTRAETAGRYRVSTLVSVFAAGIRRDTAHSAAPPTVPRARQGEPQRARHVAQRPGQSHGVRI